MWPASNGATFASATDSVVRLSAAVHDWCMLWNWVEKGGLPRCCVGWVALHRCPAPPPLSSSLTHPPHLPLAEGAHAKVYEAVWRGKDVAVKVLQDTFTIREIWNEEQALM